MRASLVGLSQICWLGSLLVACADPPADPLDPAEIDDAARAEGDAAGTMYSGGYLIKLTSVPDCDCPSIFNMDLCRADINALVTRGGNVHLSHADGTLLLTEDRGLLTLSGAIEADGAFDLAAIQGFGSVLGDLALYIRLTGRFSGPAGFTGTVQSRALGTVDGQDVDCRTEADLSGVRTPSP